MYPIGNAGVPVPMVTYENLDPHQIGGAARAAAFRNALSNGQTIFLFKY
jgi:hypothetical protein